MMQIGADAAQQNPVMYPIRALRAVCLQDRPLKACV
jgi:hypothetical protein